MSKQRNPDIDFGFHAQIPRIVRTEHKDLTPVQKWIYVCLKDLCGDHGTCYRALRVLAEEVGVSIGMLSESIPALHKAGLIHAEKKRRSNNPTAKEVWHITIVDIWQANAKAHPTKRSHSEQHSENVHTVNDNVHSMNNPPTECSQNEQECSHSETEGLPGSSSNIEAIASEARERVFASAPTPSSSEVTQGNVTQALGEMHASPPPVLPARAPTLDSIPGGEPEVTQPVPLKQTSSPVPPVSLPPSSEEHQADGAATERGSAPRASEAKEKPKRKKPPEVQLSLAASQLKEWYEELRGVNVSFSKRNVAAFESLAKKEGTENKDMFLNVVSLLDIDPWFEKNGIGVDPYWIERQWENKYIFLQRKKPPIVDKSSKPVDIYTANSMDKEKMQRRIEEMKANAAKKAAERGVSWST